MEVIQKTYRIAGGAPAGISILPGELGCLTNRTSMRITTMHGNRTTTPRGTDILELPFNLRGLRKKARREVIPLDFAFVFSSLVGRCEEVAGTRLYVRRKRSMMADLQRWCIYSSVEVDG